MAKIQLNGRKILLMRNMSIIELLKKYKIDDKKVAFELNGKIIQKNLYKKKLTVYFLKFLRKDIKFGNSDQLVKQMNKDVISAKKELKTKLVS